MDGTTTDFLIRNQARNKYRVDRRPVAGSDAVLAEFMHSTQRIMLRTGEKPTVLIPECPATARLPPEMGTAHWTIALRVDRLRGLWKILGGQRKAHRLRPRSKASLFEASKTTITPRQTAYGFLHRQVSPGTDPCIPENCWPSNPHATKPLPQ